MNSLLLAFARCGCAPSLYAREADSLTVPVGDERVSFSLRPVNPKPERRAVGAPCGLLE